MLGPRCLLETGEGQGRAPSHNNSGRVALEMQ